MQKLLQRYRYSVILLKQLVKTDFKLRYQGSALGYMWSLLRPLLLFLILYLVFTVFLPVGKGVPHYPQYLLLGIVLWNYFAEVTTGSVAAIVGKGDLLRKINFPKYVIILASSFSALINLFLNSIVIAIFIYFGHVGISWNALLLIPLIVELFILAISIAFLLSALFVRFRDVSYIWEVVMQAAFYATPILYALQRVPHEYAKFLILNPMAQIIQDARHALIGPYALTISDIYGGDRLIWLIPLGITAVLAISGGSYFRARSKYFAEEV
ncbi:MAG: ABC transporter permease [Patescibacteria group bacterium]|nr:ABC transporter permease [Patescibacteria group bacterium]